MHLFAGVYNIALVIILMFISENVCHDHDHLNKKYGPYKITFKTFEECRGPRPKNLTYVVLKGPYKKGNGNNHLVSLNFTVPQIIKIESMRMTSYYIKDEVKNYVSTYRTQTPCTHFLLGPLIALLLNATSSCTVKPGIYVTEIDSTAFANKIFTSLIYGDYTSKLVTFNKKGNIACWIADISVVPALR